MSAPVSAWTADLTSRSLHTPAPHATFGAKGARLRQLHELGVRIPPTLCVTSSCAEHLYRAALQRASNLEELLSHLTHAALPAPLLDELSAWLRHQDAVRWCVRSSGLEEDGSTRSFAGQHLTLLDVCGLSALEQAIKDVIASALSDHALLYRHRAGAPLVPGGMAVLIQPMLTPTIAGVLFSREPGPHPSSARLVSMTKGLGVGVVDGSDETTTCRVEKASRYVTHVEGAQERPLLTTSELDALLDVVDTLERRTLEESKASFAHGHDLEWAVVRGLRGASILYILQWRPVTSAWQEEGGSQGDIVLTNANVGEALPGVGTPLTWSVIHRFSQRGFERAFGSMGLDVPPDVELVRSIRGRVYLNLTQFMEIASAIPMLRPTALFELAGGGGASEVEQTYQSRAPWRFLLRLPWTSLRATASQLATPSVSKLWEAYFSRQRDAFFLRDLSRLTHRELSKVWSSTEALFDRNGLVMLAGSSNFLLLYVLWREMLRAWGGEQALEQEQLFLGGLAVKSAEPGLDLLRLGRIARRSLRLRDLIKSHDASALYDVLTQRASTSADVADFMHELDLFRARHGHRAPREAEIATPRWREDTTFLFELLKGFVRAPTLIAERELERDYRVKREEKERALRGLFSGVSLRLVRSFLEVVRASAQRRETLRALVVDALDMYRVLALESGERMQRRGLIGEADDVFFLTMEELRGWLERPEDLDAFAEYKMRAIVRRSIHRQLVDLPDPPGTFILQESGRIISLDSAVTRADQDTSPGAHSTLYGLPGSRGVASGTARVLSDPSQRARLHHGDVLVVPYADVGWTPLFLSAGAVVMSLGGPLSHACVVAREYGIPVVANVSQALDVIRDGDYVVVNGDRGVVMVERRSSAEEE